MAWNFDMATVPKGRTETRQWESDGKTISRVVFIPEPIIAAGRGVVTVTRWLDDQQRFDMFTAEVPPFAWMPYPGPRAYVDAKGKTRYAVDLPPHPNGDEPWLATFMRERGNAVPRAQRQRACLDWIAARMAA